MVMTVEALWDEGLLAASRAEEKTKEHERGHSLLLICIFRG